MRTPLETLFIIRVCDKVLLSPYFQFWFGLQQLGYRSQCGSLSSSSLEFIELGALYLRVFFFPYQILDVFNHLFFSNVFSTSSYFPWFSIVYVALFDGWHSLFSISFSPIQTLISCLWGQYSVFKWAEFPFARCFSVVGTFCSSCFHCYKFLWAKDFKENIPGIFRVFPNLCLALFMDDDFPFPPHICSWLLISSLLISAS